MQGIKYELKNNKIVISKTPEYLALLAGEERKKVEDMFIKFLQAVPQSFKELEDFVLALQKRVEELTLEKGDKGDVGPQGIQGVQGIPGADGLNGTNGIDGLPGQNGISPDINQIIREVVFLIPTPKDGLSGLNGTDGKDFVLTDELLDEIIKKVLAKMPPMRLGGGGSGVVGREVNEESVTCSGTTCTLAHTPKTGSLHFFRGGTRQQQGSGKDYTLSGKTVTLSVTADPLELFLADYRW